MAAITLNFTEAILVQFWGLYCPEHTSGQIHKYSCLTFLFRGEVLRYCKSTTVQLHAAPHREKTQIQSSVSMHFQCVVRSSKKEKKKSKLKKHT